MIKSFSGQVAFYFVIPRAISAYVGENSLSQYNEFMCCLNIRSFFGRLSQPWLEIRYENFFPRHKAFKHSISEGVLGYQGYRHFFCQEQAGPQKEFSDWLVGCS